MSNNQATVIRASRRWVALVDKGGKQLEARSSTKTLEVTVGDQIIYTPTESDYVIQEILPRKNQLERKNDTRSKVFAANVDHLFIVCGVGALFNTAFIDRALISAIDQNIPVTLIINKIDLSNQIPEQLTTYQAIGVPILRTSATKGIGLDLLKQELNRASDRLVVFCGISGVGKSSLLNSLIPESNRNVGAVSERTGQGTQTTTQAEAFALTRPGMGSLYVVDLPGFSQFGMIHVALERLTFAFPEFQVAARNCSFNDCTHRQEPVCGVKQMLEAGKIAQFRYQSYLEIRDELERARSY